MTISLNYGIYAQVGINTATPGTTLDVNGAITNRETSQAVASNAATIQSNVSQVRLTGAATATVNITGSTPPNPGQRLIIYNNTTGGFGATLNGATIPNGQALEFAYSNGSWVATNGGNSWSTLGNAGTTSGTNFLGTTDNQNLIFKRNNVDSGFLGTQNTTFGAGALPSNSTAIIANSAFGVSALSSATTPSAVGNSAFGYQSLTTNTTGAQNSAVGYQSLRANTTGSQNTALGYGALTGNTIGGSNVAVGVNALDVLTGTTATYNVAVGTDALGTVTSGTGNIGIGDNAGNPGLTGGSAFTSGSGNIIIGTNATLPNATGSNQMNIGNAIFATNLSNSITNLTSNVGIGTTNPINALHVVATASSLSGFSYNLMDAPVPNASDNSILRLRNTSTLAIGNRVSLGFSNNGPTSGGPTWELGTIRTRAAANGGDDFFISVSTGGAQQPRLRMNANSGFLGVGVGSNDPLARIHVGSGDVYIDNIGSGVIMKSDNGSCWRVRVTDTGTFTSATITCP